ncbi:MAG: hypothetical protein IJJ51_02115 [Kiritimatiellae bacterium]|nr:hypothetical protein [Kiritimatiellia bacterium]
MRQEKKQQTQNGLFWFFVYLVCCTIVLGACFVAWPELVRHRALSRQDAELARLIEEKKREIAHLKDCQQRFKADAEFVETIARQNRRVFPGEFVFIFEGGEGDER